MSKGGLLMVTTSYPGAGDGSEAAGAFVAELAAFLSTTTPVQVVAPGDRETVEKESSGVTVFRYATSGRALSTLNPLRPLDAFEIARTLMRGQRAVNRALAVSPAEHILALWALPSGEWARRAAKRARIPYSVWTLGSDIWSLGPLPGVRQALARVLQEAEHCYSDGLQLAGDTRAIAGRQVQFLPSARSGKGQRPAPVRIAPPYRLIFLGRWHPNKGIDLLLEALEQLGSNDWARIDHVRIAGGGPLQANVARSVRKLQELGRPVQLEGYLDSKGAHEALVTSDIVLIPSRIESIPLVFSDALKSGCAVVTMPVGDLQRLVAEKSVGWVASDVTATSYSVVLRDALKEGPAHFSDSISGLARDFSLEHVGQRLLKELRLDAGCRDR